MKIKKFIFIFFLASVLLVNNVYSQETDQLAIKVSYNFLKLEYNHDFFSQKIHTGFALGLGSKRSISELTDLHGEIHTKFPLLTRKRSEVLLNTYGGLCHNKEAGLFPFIGTEFEYEFKIGQRRNHALILCTGVRYGKIIFVKEYENQYIKALTEESYSLPAFYIMAGYGFRFLQ